MSVKDFLKLKQFYDENHKNNAFLRRVASQIFHSKRIFVLKYFFSNS